jgi:raffinose/stachyose/melibiose transport system permease protein
MKTNREQKWFIVLSLIPAVVLFGIFYILPMLGLIASTFFDWNTIKMGGFIGIGNYVKMFQDHVFYVALQNNLSWSLVAACIHIPLALLVALLLSKKVRGWKVLRTIYFLPHVISVTAFAVIWMNVFNPSFGLINSLLKVMGLTSWCHNWLYDQNLAWPAILLTWVFHVGLYAVIILGEILSIPEELFESAEIDGASGFKQSFHITIPLMRNITGTCVILTVTGGLRYFEGLYIMTNGAPNFRTETLALYLYQKIQLIQYSYANTIGVALLTFGLLFVISGMKLFKIGKSDW